MFPSCSLQVIAVNPQRYKTNCNDFCIFQYPKTVFLDRIVGTLIGLIEFSNEVYDRQIEYLTVRFQGDLYTVGLVQKSSELIVAFTYSSQLNFDRDLLNIVLTDLINLFGLDNDFGNCLENLCSLLLSPQLLSNSSWRCHYCDSEHMRQSAHKAFGFSQGHPINLALFYDGICIFTNFNGRSTELLLAVVPSTPLQDWKNLNGRRLLLVTIGRFRCVLLASDGCKPRLIRKFRRNSILALLKMATSVCQPQCFLCERYCQVGLDYWCSIEVDSVEKVCLIHNFRSRLAASSDLPSLQQNELWLMQILREICDDFDNFREKVCQLQGVTVRFERVLSSSIITVRCNTE